MKSIGIENDDERRNRRGGGVGGWGRGEEEWSDNQQLEEQVNFLILSFMYTVYLIWQVGDFGLATFHTEPELVASSASSSSSSSSSSSALAVTGVYPTPIGEGDRRGEVPEVMNPAAAREAAASLSGE